MPTFSYRKKNVKISVRCGARCRAYHASSMGEGKGPPHNCAPARFLFFGFFNSMESAFPYEESFSVRPNPVRRRLSWRRPPRKALILRRATPTWPGRASGNPDGLSAGRTWCFTPCKALFLRPEAPCLSAGPSLRRPGRGASPSAKPYFFVRKHHATWVRLSLRRLGRGASPSAKTYFFVRKHHVYRPGRASGDPGFPFPIRRECDEYI